MHFVIESTKYKVLWNEQKNTWLKFNRGITFEDIVQAINDGYLLDVIENPNKEKYGHQKTLTVILNDYVCKVPFVQHDKETVFFKTAYFSRKDYKHYLLSNKK